VDELLEVDQSRRGDGVVLSTRLRCLYSTPEDGSVLGRLMKGLAWVVERSTAVHPHCWPQDRRPRWP